jgi:hypothetical protein
MSKVEKQKVEEDAIVKETNDYITSIDIARELWLRDCFINMNYLEGRHRIMYDMRTRNIRILPIEDNEVRTEVAFMRKILRGLKKTMIKNDLKISVRNTPSTSGTEEELHAARIVLNKTMNTQEFKEHVKDLLDYGLIKTWGLISVLPAEDIENTGKVEVATYDPMDIYPVGGKPFIKDWHKLILTMMVNIDDLKKDKLYKDSPNLDKISPDSKTSQNTWKDTFMRSYGNMRGVTNDTVILKQVFTEEEKGIRIVAIAGDQIIRNEILKGGYTKLEQIFSLYCPERRAGQLYSRAWLTELQNVNRALDRNLTNLETYDHMFSKGRFMREINSRTTTKITENGQEIVYEGTPPQFQPAAPLNEGSLALMNTVERIGEDVGGVHSDSMGRVSGSSSSGIAIKYLIAQDIDNTFDPVDSLKTTLSDVAKNILFIATNYFTKGLTYQDDTKTQMTIDNNPDTTNKTIKPFEDIRVEVVPGSAWSDMQAADDLFNLRKFGIPIPDKYILQAYSFGNVAEILDDMQRDEENKYKAETPEMKIADAENQKMLMNQEVSVNPSDDNEIHLAIHQAMLQNMNKLNPAMPLLSKHVMEHQQALQMAIQNMQQSAGIGSATVPPPTAPLPLPTLQQPQPM